MKNEQNTARFWADGEAAGLYHRALPCVNDIAPVGADFFANWFNP